MFRFTLRDLLWLMVVVAFGCAWWIDQRRLKYEIDKLTPKKYAMYGSLSEAELITAELITADIGLIEADDDPAGLPIRRQSADDLFATPK